MSVRAALEARLHYMQGARDRLVIDGDVHPTDAAALPADMAARMADDPDYFHGRPLLESDLPGVMDAAGVDMALCWQNPATLPYTDDQGDNATRLTGANARIHALATRHPTRVIPAGWTDPKALGVNAACDLARTCVRDFGMPVVKMNPAQNAYPIDDPMVLEVVDVIAALGAVPAFHFGADTEFTPTAGLERVAAHLGDHPVIGVHMGGGGGHFVESEDTYQSARALGLSRSNVFYVLSAKRDAHIESDLITYAAQGAHRRIGVASDAPYSGMVWNFAAYRGLFAHLQSGTHPDARAKDAISDSVVADYMGGNLADLVIAADRRLLARL